MRLLDRRIPVDLANATTLPATGSQLSITEIKIKSKKKKKHKKKEISSTSSSSDQTAATGQSGKTIGESDKRQPVRRQSDRRQSIKNEKSATSEKIAVRSKDKGIKKNEDKSYAVGSSSETTESLTSSDFTHSGKVSCKFMFCL